MKRCPHGAAGHFRVEFAFLTSDGEADPAEYIADIGPHAPVIENAVLVEDVPRASQNAPYVGELCSCELAWLAKLPGKAYSMHRRYVVTPAGQGG